MHALLVKSARVDASAIAKSHVAQDDEVAIITGRVTSDVDGAPQAGKPLCLTFRSTQHLSICPLYLPAIMQFKNSVRSQNKVTKPCEVACHPVPMPLKHEWRLGGLSEKQREMPFTKWGVAHGMTAHLPD
jgi:hypothetical protein